MACLIGEPLLSGVVTEKEGDTDLADEPITGEPERTVGLWEWTAVIQLKTANPAPTVSPVPRLPPAVSPVPRMPPAVHHVL
ncbi:hypothetical protein SRHO_G00177750 [Serrasalmus rhombeus]